MRGSRVRLAIVVAVAASLRSAGAVADVPNGDLPKPDPLRPDDAVPASNDEPAMRARALYDMGTQAFARGRYLEAALDFEVAATSKRSPIALYTAALSWERANSPERAADDYARALVTGALPLDTAAAAAQRLAQLRRVLGAITVTAPADWRVQLDDHSEVEPPATLHGAAGVHTMTVRAPGQPLQHVPLVLRAGETGMPINLSTGTPLAPLTAEAPPRSASPPARQVVGTVALGAAFTALLAGTLLGLEALDARNAYRASPVRATYDHAASLQAWTDVALVSGGVLLAGGLVLVLWPSARATTASVTESRVALAVAPVPGGVVFRGEF